MGMFLKIWALIMGMIMAFFSAKTPVKAYEPETADINGVTYKNCFLPEYSTYNGMKASDDDPICLIPGESESFLGAQKGWYAITDKIVSRGLYPNNGNGSTGKRVYCVESDWNELKAYYGDMKNWRFFAGTKYCINGKMPPDPIEIERENNNLELWSELMQFTYDCNNNRQSEMKKQGLYYELPQKINTVKFGIYFYMQSDDELFSAGTGCGDVIDYEGTLYLQVVSVGDMYVGAYKLPAELQTFIRELDEKCDFSSFYWPVY